MKEKRSVKDAGPLLSSFSGNWVKGFRRFFIDERPLEDFANL